MINQNKRSEVVTSEIEEATAAALSDVTEASERHVCCAPVGSVAHTGMTDGEVRWVRNQWQRQEMTDHHDTHARQHSRVCDDSEQQSNAMQQSWGVGQEL